MNCRDCKIGTTKIEIETGYTIYQCNDPNGPSDVAHEWFDKTQSIDCQYFSQDRKVTDEHFKRMEIAGQYWDLEIDENGFNK